MPKTLFVILAFMGVWLLVCVTVIDWLPGPAVQPTLMGVTYKGKKNTKQNKLTVFELEVRSKIHTSIEPQAGDTTR